MTFEEKVESGIIYKSGDEWIDMDGGFDLNRPPLSEEEKRRMVEHFKQLKENGYDMAFYSEMEI